MTLQKARPPVDHDTLVYRLSEILVKLNRGEKLDPRRLAAEFNVDLRTIQRDLNQRFAYLDLVTSGGRYEMPSAVLGKLSTRDIERFAVASGTRGLFPSLSHAFVRQLLAEGETSALLVRGHHYEEVEDRATEFADLRRAIEERRRVHFDFGAASTTVEKTFADVEPYKLLNQKGVWYLIGRHHGKLKTFGFTRIRGLRVDEGGFDFDEAFAEQLANNEGLWQSEKMTRVMLTVSAEAAPYFRRRQLVANQVVEATKGDGSMVLSTRVGHSNEIIPIVRYWIPHLRIVEPIALQESVEKSLTDYLVPSRAFMGDSPPGG